MKCEECKYFEIVDFKIVCTRQNLEFDENDETENIAYWCQYYLKDNQDKE